MNFSIRIIFWLLTGVVFTNSAHALIPDDGKSWYYFDKYRAYEETDKDLSLDLKLRQKGESFENSLESSFLYTIEATPEFKYKFNSFVTFNAKASINSRIGSVQSRFGDLRSRSAIIIRDTRLKFFNQYMNKSEDFSLNSYLSLGAIDQGGHHRNFSNFISRRALPGVEERLILRSYLAKNNFFGVEFRGFQGIPTAQSDTLDFTEKETTPFFASGNIAFSYTQEKQKNNFRLEARYGLFSFSDLPAVIADESRLYGNSVDFVGAASEFQYGFKGWTGGWTAMFSRGAYSGGVFVNMLQNLDAPDKRNQAQLISFRMKYVTKSNNEFELEPFSFFTESDASVASYNQLAGHNNREGYGFMTTLNFKKKKMKFKFSYAHSDLIETNSLQLKQDYFGLNVEFKNDLI